MVYEYSLIETPFEYRRCCWFCGEPKQYMFGFPHNQYLVFQCTHSPLQVPACKECYAFASKAKVNNIWQVQVYVKQQLMKHYKKDLAIGLNWTEEELRNSGFEGGSFEGFQRSAWFMYEVAKNRVSYSGWPLYINGLPVEYMEEKRSFIFDGIRYPTIDDAIKHYAQTFDLSLLFFKKVLAELGDNKFGEAVRYARLFVGTTPQEQTIALNKLKNKS